jgi:hypothetical protein
MTLKKIAIAFGIIMVLAGLLGFVPAVTPGGKLLGIFAVNTMHNIVHIATGIVALITGFASERAAKIYFQIFGVVYAIVAVLGFVTGDGMILGMVPNNTADTWLHVVIALLALYLGFVMKAPPVVATP